MTAAAPRSLADGLVQLAARARRVVRAVEDGLLVAVFALLLVAVLTPIVARLLGIGGWAAAGPIARHLVLWITLLGAMIATREEHHVTVNIAGLLLRGRAAASARALAAAFGAAVCGVLAVAAIDFLGDELAGGARAFGAVPTWLAELILPFGFGLMALRFGVQALRHGHAGLTGRQRPAAGAPPPTAATGGA